MSRSTAVQSRRWAGQWEVQLRDERLGLGWAARGGQGDMGTGEDWMEDASSDGALSIASAACRVQWENMRPISGGRPDAGP